MRPELRECRIPAGGILRQSFKVRHSDGKGGWIWGLPKKERHVPYRLREFLGAISSSAWRPQVTGEKLARAPELPPQIDLSVDNGGQAALLHFQLNRDIAMLVELALDEGRNASGSPHILDGAHHMAERLPVLGRKKVLRPLSRTWQKRRAGKSTERGWIAMGLTELFQLP